MARQSRLENKKGVYFSGSAARQSRSDQSSKELEMYFRAPRMLTTKIGPVFCSFVCHFHLIIFQFNIAFFFSFRPSILCLIPAVSYNSRLAQYWYRKFNENGMLMRKERTCWSIADLTSIHATLSQISAGTCAFCTEGESHNNNTAVTNGSGCAHSCIKDAFDTTGLWRVASCL